VAVAAAAEQQVLSAPRFLRVIFRAVMEVTAAPLLPLI
jgi:hypothetical protein